MESPAPLLQRYYIFRRKTNIVKKPDKVFEHSYLRGQANTSRRTDSDFSSGNDGRWRR